MTKSLNPKARSPTSLTQSLPGTLSPSHSAHSLTHLHYLTHLSPAHALHPLPHPATYTSTHPPALTLSLTHPHIYTPHSSTASPTRPLTHAHPLSHSSTPSTLSPPPLPNIRILTFLVLKDQGQPNPYPLNPYPCRMNPNIRILTFLVPARLVLKDQTTSPVHSPAMAPGQAAEPSGTAPARVLASGAAPALFPSQPAPSEELPPTSPAGTAPDLHAAPEAVVAAEAVAAPEAAAAATAAAAAPPDVLPCVPGPRMPPCAAGQVLQPPAVVGGPEEKAQAPA